MLFILKVSLGLFLLPYIALVRGLLTILLEAQICLVQAISLYRCIFWFLGKTTCSQEYSAFSALIGVYSSMGVVALSHSMRCSLNRKLIPNSSSWSLPMIMSYLLDKVSVSSTKAFQLIFLCLWKAGSVNLILQVLVVWKLPALVFHLQDFSCFCI